MTDDPVCQPPNGSPSTKPQTKPAPIRTAPVTMEKARRHREETLSSAAFNARTLTGST